MTTTTPTRGATLAHAAATLAGHLAEHALPEPASLSVSTSYGLSTLTAQLCSTTVPTVATDLLAWTNTLSAISIEAWRPPAGDHVHLSLYSILTGPAGVVALKVFGGVDYDPLRFADLQPHTHRGISLSLDRLRSWAANRGDQ
jgi:hypothetical protein